MRLMTALVETLSAGFAVNTQDKGFGPVNGGINYAATHLQVCQHPEAVGSSQ